MTALTIARAHVLVAYTALLVLFAVKTALFGPDAAAGIVAWLLQAVPLLLFLPGLLRGSWRTHIWLCFVILIYFTVSVPRLFMPDPHFLDYLATALTVLLFIASLCFARWCRRQAPAVGHEPIFRSGKDG